MTGIIQLLATRHSGDLFVVECKDGPSQGTSHLRMDAWAMKRAYSKPLTVAYEIKVARSDFLQDKKWPGYLDYCNEFYFVCPRGLIDPSEVGDSAGLIWTSKNGNKLYTKKKAPWRDVQIPESLWRYILISRTVITRDNHITKDEDYWRNWMIEKKDKITFGHRVGRRLQQVINAKIHDVETKIHEVRAENKSLQATKTMLDGLGIEPDTYPWLLRQRVDEQLRAFKEIIPKPLVNEMQRLKDSITSALDEIDKMNNKESQHENNQT